VLDEDDRIRTADRGLEQALGVGGGRGDGDEQSDESSDSEEAEGAS